MLKMGNVSRQPESRVTRERGTTEGDDAKTASFPPPSLHALVAQRPPRLIAKKRKGNGAREKNEEPPGFNTMAFPLASAGHLPPGHGEGEQQLAHESRAGHGSRESNAIHERPQSRISLDLNISSEMHESIGRHTQNEIRRPDGGSEVNSQKVACRDLRATRQELLASLLRKGRQEHERRESG
ncbi:hypothetical protein K438DRAFT_1754040 [Mycena galopus ATCC 62051]|nr:hypothetical protein K438DRAFT_1754040 [Mycena galopus ATCC 62051]